MDLSSHLSVHIQMAFEKDRAELDITHEYELFHQLCFTLLIMNCHDVKYNKYFSLVLQTRIEHQVAIS